MKKMIVFVFSVAILITAVAFNVTPTKSTADNASDSRVQRVFQIAPVPLHTQGRNRAQIGLGSYLVNAVSECNDCHSCPTFAPGHNPFDGVGDGALNPENHLAGGVNFGPGDDGEDIISK